MDNLSIGDTIQSPSGQLFSVLSTHDAYHHPKYKRGKSVTLHDLSTGTAFMVQLSYLRGWTLSSDAVSMNVSSSDSQVADKDAQPHVEGGVS